MLKLALPRLTKVDTVDRSSGQGGGMHESVILSVLITITIAVMKPYDQKL